MKVGTINDPFTGKRETLLGKRDAYHTATIVSYSKTENLASGDHVQFMQGGHVRKVIKNSVAADGIIDPFVKSPIAAGCEFLVFLKPDSTKNLSHVFETPMDHLFLPEESKNKIIKVSNNDYTAEKKALNDKIAELQQELQAEKDENERLDDGCRGCY